MRYVLLVLLLILSTSVYSQVVHGRITDLEGKPISFASIGIKGSSVGTASDESGFFQLEVPAGQGVLVISSIGYRTLFLDLGKSELGNIQLEESMLGLNEVVVTGTTFETFLKASPVKVEVIRREFMMKNIATPNIMDGLTLINGVQEVVACGVCFTNSISINGLPGQYTAVLMDGSPIYGNLAATYGLNSIPISIIDRFEVIKGPSSTLYGSEAVAGVINIITRDPSKHPSLSFDLMGTSHFESFANIAFRTGGDRTRGYTGLNHAYINKFEDENMDGFGDIVNLDRYSLFSKWDIYRRSGLPFTIAGKIYFEDRRNGVEEFLRNRAYRSLRGSNQVYGESIYTYRAELFGRYDLTDHLRLDYSMSRHYQDSYYGGSNYQANQAIFFSNLRWDKESGKHHLMTGLTLRQENYDDNTIATETGSVNTPALYFIPGIFVQDEWKLQPDVTMLSGLRIDHHSRHGYNLSPRWSLKYNPWPYTTLRLNTGTGFKVVNLFTEDHAFVSGQREVVISEELLPERSTNVSMNLNHIFTINESQGMLDLDFYYTYFSNKIIPDYGTQGQIIYRNSDGHTVSRGISLNISHEWANGISYTVGLNGQDAFENTLNVKSRLQFAPSWSGVATVNFDWKEKGWVFAYTTNITGPMRLPEVYDLNDLGIPLSQSRPLNSMPFSIHNIQVTKDWKSGLTVYGGVQNIFDYSQSGSPLVGYNDPNYSAGFSPYFDTVYAFAPLHGREIYLGVRWNYWGN